MTNEKPFKASNGYVFLRLNRKALAGLKARKARDE